MHFLTVPQELVKQKRLTPTEQRVLGVVHSFTLRKGYSWCGLRYLAASAGYSIWWTCRIIKRLERKELLFTLWRRGGKTALRFIHLKAARAFQTLRTSLRRHGYSVSYLSYRANIVLAMLANTRNRGGSTPPS